MQQILLLQRSHCCCSATLCLELWQQCFRHDKNKLWMLKEILSFRVLRTVMTLHKEERIRCSTSAEKLWLIRFDSSLLKMISEELIQIWSRFIYKVIDCWMLCRSNLIQSIKRANDSLLIIMFQICLFFLIWLHKTDLL